MSQIRLPILIAFAVVLLLSPCATYADSTNNLAFFRKHCFTCHDSDTKKGDLDLTSLEWKLSKADLFSRWVKVHDRIQSGEMPPPTEPRPTAAELAMVAQSLSDALTQAERAGRTETERTGIRRLTRTEYENTVRDLFDMPGLQLRDMLPADGTAHGFDTNHEALSISHVNMAKYVDAADRILDFAIATQPEAPQSTSRHLSLASQYYVRLLIANNGGAVYLKDKQPDPDFPPTSEHQHIDQGAHERLGMFETQSSVGVFRHEDESFRPWFQGFAAIYPGRYRISTSVWSYTWDKGKVLPARGTEAVRLSVMQMQGRGLGQDHPSYVIGYFDAPSLEAQTHAFTHWLNPGESIGFNVASLAPVHIYHQYKRNVMSFTGPGIACDGIDIEGPIHDVWPPHSHSILFGNLPLTKFDPNGGETTFPQRKPPRQVMVGAKNQADQYAGHWTVHCEEPLADASRLLSQFLPIAFRRPVDQPTINTYVSKVAERLAAGDCFELAMRWAFKAALCSPDFLYHVEPAGALDDHALACRLSYFLWNSTPDQRLTSLAGSGRIHQPHVLSEEIERMLKDGRSERFVKDFPGQWLRLREIAATDPDRTLYPEFSTYLQNSMVQETEAFFREMIERNLDATHLIDSEFAMINEKLAVHYGIDGVSGSQMRRVALPADNPRGGFLTHASLLKITANGTTTSPVPRGTFVMERLLGLPPDPPPPDIPAVEPDVRGTTTIREQLKKHRNDSACAGCHAKIDPAGFALEAFDVLGRHRDRYRTIGDGDRADRGSIDPFIHIRFKVGPDVDPSGVLPDGKQFRDVVELQQLLVKERTMLATNLARQLAVYAIGRPLSFGDRGAIASIVDKTDRQQGGLRTLIHELVQSPLFQER